MSTGSRGPRVTLWVLAVLALIGLFVSLILTYRNDTIAGVIVLFT